MSAATAELDPAARSMARMGGYSAMAESAWMGSVQATEVLDVLPAAPQGSARRRLALPKLQLKGLATRQYGIAEASFLLMASFFLSAALGAVRQVLFNAQFGVGSAANAYYAAFRLPDTLFSLIAGGALSSAMIPVLLSTLQQGGKSAELRLTRLVLTTLMAVIAMIVILGEIFTPLFVQYVLAPGFDGPTFQLTVQLTRIMLLQPLVLTIGSVATSILNSRSQFFLTALSVVSHNLTLIAGILAVRFVPGLGILGPTLGVVAGAVLQALVMLPGLRGSETLFRPVWDLRDARLREITHLLVPNGLSVAVNYSGFIVDTAFATRTGDPAALAAIYNAWLLVGLPIALLGQAIGQAAFPRLAAHAGSSDWRAMRSTLLRSLGAALGLAIPSLLALIALGRPVIHILLEHGKFDAIAGNVTYSVLVVYALGLPAFVATELVTRGLIALRDTRTPLVTNTLQLLLRIGLMTVLLPRIGVRAIPAALAISATLETLALASLLFARLQRRMARHIALEADASNRISFLKGEFTLRRL